MMTSGLKTFIFLTLTLLTILAFNILYCKTQNATTFSELDAIVATVNKCKL